MRVLPIRPNIFRFLIVFCQREPRPSVLFYDALDSAGGVEERRFNGTLEFEEFGLGILEVGGVHEFVVEEFGPFW